MIGRVRKLLKDYFFGRLRMQKIRRLLLVLSTYNPMALGKTQVEIAHARIVRARIRFGKNRTQESVITL